MLKQQTLKGSFSLNGKGLHTGVKLTVTFNPAPAARGTRPCLCPDTWARTAPPPADRFR